MIKSSLFLRSSRFYLVPFWRKFWFAKNCYRKFLFEKKFQKMKIFIKSIGIKMCQKGNSLVFLWKNNSKKAVFFNRSQQERAKVDLTSISHCLPKRPFARRRNFPIEGGVAWAQFWLIMVRGIPPLCMPLILLGGIYGGVFTPTEAAAVAGLYAVLLAGLGYRELGIKKLL